MTIVDKTKWKKYFCPTLRINTELANIIFRNSKVKLYV